MLDEIKVLFREVAEARKETERMLNDEYFQPKACSPIAASWHLDF